MDNTLIEIIREFGNCRFIEGKYGTSEAEEPEEVAADIERHLLELIKANKEYYGITPE